MSNISNFTKKEKEEKVSGNKDREAWSIECTIDELLLDLCRTEEVITYTTEDNGWSHQKTKTLHVRKYYKQAKDLMRWIPIARPVPEFVINECDLSPKVIEELEARIDYPGTLRDILNQAIGRLFEGLDFDCYHQSIARNLKVRVDP